MQIYSISKPAVPRTSLERNSGSSAVSIPAETTVQPHSSSHSSPVTTNAPTSPELIKTREKLVALQKIEKWAHQNTQFPDEARRISEQFKACWNNPEIKSLSILATSVRGLPPFPPHLTHLKFEAGSNINNCSFNWKHIGGDLHHVTFEDCHFSNTSLMNRSIEHCLFKNCHMRETMAVNANFAHTIIDGGEVINSSFEDSTFKDCTIRNVKSMSGTHFLDAAAVDSHIENSDLKNTSFFGEGFSGFVPDEKSRKTAHITIPTISVPVFPEMRGLSTPMLYHKVQAKEVNPLRIAVQAQKVTAEQVNADVHSALSLVNGYVPQGCENLPENQAHLRQHQIDEFQKLPLPQKLFRIFKDHPENYPAIKNILQKAETLVEHTNAFAFPGGEDVPPFMYGAKAAPETDPANDLRRTVLEYAIVNEIFNMRVTPALFVCRSSQILATFYGATLEQHIGEDYRNKEAGRPVNKQVNKVPRAFDGLYGKTMRGSEDFSVGSYQHQAKPIEGPHASIEEKDAAPFSIIGTSVVKSQDPSTPDKIIIQAMEAKHYPVGATQFHPEFKNPPRADTTDDHPSHLSNLRLDEENLAFSQLLSDKNTSFFDVLATCAKAHFDRQRNITPKSLDENKIAIAVSAGDTDTVKRLIDTPGINLNACDSNGNSLLHKAVARGHEQIVKLLLSKDIVNANVLNENGLTPWDLAKQNGLHDIAIFLSGHTWLRNKEDHPSLQNPLPLNTQLEHAVITGDMKGISRLMDTPGIDLNACDSNGNSLLHKAVAWGHEPAVQLLLSKDIVNPRALNEKGLTPWDLAKKNGLDDIAVLLSART